MPRRVERATVPASSATEIDVLQPAAPTERAPAWHLLPVRLSPPSYATSLLLQGSPRPRATILQTFYNIFIRPLLLSFFDFSFLFVCHLLYLCFFHPVTTHPPCKSDTPRFVRFTGTRGAPPPDKATRQGDLFFSPLLLRHATLSSYKYKTQPSRRRTSVYLQQRATPTPQSTN